jgi:esterase/lipase
MKNILFVHGFGVKKDARGMFSEIAEHFAETHNSILSDLNTVDIEGNITVPPWTEQSKKLYEKYNSLSEKDENYLIAHSQGCVVTSILGELPKISHVIFLAPPTSSNSEKTIAYFSQNPLSRINREGTSMLARRDGTYTFVEKDFWLEVNSSNLEKVYKDFLSKNKKIIVLSATEDEVINHEDHKIIFGDAVIEIKSNHDFTGEQRVALLRELQQILR